MTSKYKPGQRVEIWCLDGDVDGRWIPATLVKKDTSWGDQWTFRYSDGNTDFSVERWIRPPHALIQLAEAGQD